MKRKIFALPDFIVVAVILAVCITSVILSAFYKNSGSRAVISVDNEVVLELPLNEDTIKTVETRYGINTVCIENGVCYVSDADCKDKICKNHSAIKNKGESIVCLPHKFIAEVR